MREGAYEKFWLCGNERVFDSVCAIGEWVLRERLSWTVVEDRDERMIVEGLSLHDSLCLLQVFLYGVSHLQLDYLCRAFHSI